jgi:hypothetical protein
VEKSLRFGSYGFILYILHISVQKKVQDPMVAGGNEVDNQIKNQIKTIKQIELAYKQPEKTTPWGSMKTLLKIDSHGAEIRLRTNREWIWPKDDFRFDLFGYITVIRILLCYNLQQNQCTKHPY